MKTIAAVAFLVLLAPSAYADGLLYVLPDDGAWVHYELKVTMNRGDEQRDATGSLKMSSVGKAVVDGLECRWLEFSLVMTMNDMERTIVCKILAPEAELKEGGDPLGKRVRGWIRMAKNVDPGALTDANLGPMPSFLAGPLQNLQDLAAEEVESKLGKTMCSGVSGTAEWKEGESANAALFTIRKHPNAAFGVVAADIRIDTTGGSGKSRSIRMQLKLKDFGYDAKSELPNSK